MSKIIIGVSSCLLGHKVRHDGGHKQNTFVVKHLGNHFELLPFCPEMEMGLGTPRPAIRLVRQENSIHLLGVKDSTIDHTKAMESLSQDYSQSLEHLSGYVLKKDSPSCGKSRVRVWNKHGQADRNGTGIFAGRLMGIHPNLPVEEEGHLNDDVLRENFIERVFVYARWLELINNGLTVHSLMEFHRRHKFNLLAHNEQVYRQLGPLIAATSKDHLSETAGKYISWLMKGLQTPATRKRHTNVLMHSLGFLKSSISSEDKKEMQEVLDRYRAGLVPLVVPVTLLKHHMRRASETYIESQHYIDPYPEDFMLRNNL